MGIYTMREGEKERRGYGLWHSYTDILVHGKSNSFTDGKVKW
jgi:hypothetical protein